MFIDIHCHLDFFKDGEVKGIVERAEKKKVGLILTQGIDAKSNEKVLELEKKYNIVHAALGLYPTDAVKLSDKEVEKIIDTIRKNKDNVLAIGEIGMDYKWTLKKEDRKRQAEIFRKMISLGIELDKPVIVHARQAEEDVVNILEEMKAKKVIMHCFTGSMKLVKRIFENKWYMTIPTMVTYLEHFQKVIEIAPIEKLFCETDSPYLHPIKGEKNNEPGNVIESYKKIAEIKKITLDETKRIINANYKRLF